MSSVATAARTMTVLAAQFTGTEDSMRDIFDILPAKAQEILSRFSHFPMPEGHWMVVIGDHWVAMSDANYQAGGATQIRHQDIPVQF